MTITQQIHSHLSTLPTPKRTEIKPGLLLFSIILILISCNSKTEKADKKIEECEVTYIVLAKENSKYCNYLSEEIKEKAKAGTGNIKKYDSLTVEYVNYLDGICDAISKNSASIFFERDSYSEKGKEFIQRTQEYQTAVEALAGDKIKKRLNLVLNTNDVRIANNDVTENNEFNKRELNTIYAFYLDYYYKGFPINQSLALLSSKKLSILEMEMEYILLNQENR